MNCLLYFSAQMPNRHLKVNISNLCSTHTFLHGVDSNSMFGWLIAFEPDLLSHMNTLLALPSKTQPGSEHFSHLITVGLVGPSHLYYLLQSLNVFGLLLKLSFVATVHSAVISTVKLRTT